MKIKQKMYVVEWFDRDVKIQSYEPNCPSSMLLGEVEVEVNFNMPPKTEIRDKKVAILKKEISNVRADYQVNIDSLEDEMQKLMAITNE